MSDAQIVITIDELRSAAARSITWAKDGKPQIDDALLVTAINHILAPKMEAVRIAATTAANRRLGAPENGSERTFEELYSDAVYKFGNHVMPIEQARFIWCEMLPRKN